MDNQIDQYVVINDDELNFHKALATTLKLLLLEGNKILGIKNIKNHQKLEYLLIITPLFVFSNQDPAIQECNSLPEIFSDGVSIFISANHAKDIIQENCFSYFQFNKSRDFFGSDKFFYLLHSFLSPLSNKQSSVISHHKKYQPVMLVDKFYFADVIDRRKSKMSIQFTRHYPSNIEIQNCINEKNSILDHALQLNETISSYKFTSESFYSSWLRTQIRLILEVNSFVCLYKNTTDDSKLDQHLSNIANFLISYAENLSEPSCLAYFNFKFSDIEPAINLIILNAVKKHSENSGIGKSSSKYTTMINALIGISTQNKQEQCKNFQEHFKKI